MTVAARKIDWASWSQSRFLAWAETQPGFCHYEFDGFQPVAIAPVTIGHNRIGRNIREAIRPRLPAGAPCDTYGPLDAIETVGGALREPDALIACSRPHRTAIAVPAPIVVCEVASFGRGNRRRDEQYNVRAAQGTMRTRPGRAEEVAAAILVLASDDASYVTGALLFVDGGMTAMCGVFGRRSQSIAPSLLRCYAIANIDCGLPHRNWIRRKATPGAA
jgi:hypothetical protein